MRLQLGIPDHHKPAAVALYWQAFGPKLGLILGPARRAHRFLAQAMRQDLAIIAVDDRDRLAGLAGFCVGTGSFAGGEWSDLHMAYGPVGARWRAGILQRLSGQRPESGFLLDGICVAEPLRGRGIGGALLAAIETEAKDRGFAEISLDVVNRNHRARALYLRNGYREAQAWPLGWLRPVFGFDESIRMVKPLAPPAGPRPATPPRPDAPG